MQIICNLNKENKLRDTIIIIFEYELENGLTSVTIHDIPYTQN